MMRVILVPCLLLFFLLSSAPASAEQTRADIMEAYRTAMAARAAGKPREEANFAYKAWQLSEDIQGDSRMTGDLANNFALTRVPADNVRHVEKTTAFLRSIELARFYDEDKGDIEIQRRILFIDAALDGFVPISRGDAGVGKHLRELREAIQTFGSEDSIYLAEWKALDAIRDLKRGRMDRALEKADQAIALFDKVNARLPSVYPYKVLMAKAVAYQEQEDWINAALTLQTLTRRIEETGYEDPSIRAVALPRLYQIMGEMQKEGLMDAAKARGFEPFTAADLNVMDVRPLVRVPPYMPSNARRSGWVRVGFDIDAQGRPINVKTLQSSEKLFEKPAVKSVENWVYAPGFGVEDRQGLETMIRFMLTNSRGKLIESRKPVPEFEDLQKPSEPSP